MSTNSLVSTTKLGEYFAKLPACKANGTNWIFFQDCFLFAVNAAGLSDHFDDGPTGTTSEPTKPQVANPTNLTAEEKEAIKQYPLTRRIWKSEQAVIKQGIASVIPDSLFLKVKGEKTAREMWNKVKAEYEKKSKMVTVDMRRKLQDEKCPEGGDVKAHLMKLQTIREGLITMGADLRDENFVAIVLGSLPTSYKTYLSVLTGAATLLGKALDPDIVLQCINDEAEQKTMQTKERGEREAAFYSGNGSKRPKKCPDRIECYNCHKKGHMAKDCWAKGDSKEGQNPQRKGQGKVNIVQAESTTDAAWFAANYEMEQEEINQPPIENKDNNNIPELEDTSRNNGEAEEPKETYETTEKTLLTSANLAATATTTGPEHKL